MVVFHSFIFILESIGTQELILIGLIALIVFGPRKLPQMARKLGGMMSELRKVSNDFRETWEREASLDDSRFEDNQIAPAVPREIPRRELPPERSEGDEKSGSDPEIREMSKDEFKKFSMPKPEDSAATLDPDAPEEEEKETLPAADDKRNWL